MLLCLAVSSSVTGWKSITNFTKYLPFIFVLFVIFYYIWKRCKREEGFRFPILRRSTIFQYASVGEGIDRCNTLFQSATFDKSKEIVTSMEEYQKSTKSMRRRSLINTMNISQIEGGGFENVDEI